MERPNSDATVADQAAWLCSALSSGVPGRKPKYPLILDGLDVSKALSGVGGPALEIEFNEVVPAKIDLLQSAQSKQVYDKPSGEFVIEVNLWNALTCLVRERMISSMTLPVNGADGVLGAITIDTENVARALQQTTECVRRGMLLRAIVEIAAEHYDTGRTVEAELGNLPEELDES